MITIGSDPEFIILDKHENFVPANEFFEERRYEDLWDAEIGIDECDVIGELRPRYATNPIDHHGNIQHLIEQIDTTGGYILRAGTIVEGLSIGGHIHIGGFEQPVYDNQKKYEEWPNDMNCLANYLSLYAGIPLRKIEHPKDLQYRGLNPDGYGLFGDNNHTEYGIEFRMPASWLVSSKISMSALCLTHVVANEFKIHPEDIYQHINIKHLLQKKSVESIIKKVEGMKEYKLYSSEIEPLFQLINDGKRWKDKINFKDMW